MITPSPFKFIEDYKQQPTNTCFTSQTQNDQQGFIDIYEKVKKQILNGVQLTRHNLDQKNIEFTPEQIEQFKNYLVVKLQEIEDKNIETVQNISNNKIEERSRARLEKVQNNVTTLLGKLRVKCLQEVREINQLLSTNIDQQELEQILLCMSKEFEINKSSTYQNSFQLNVNDLDQRISTMEDKYQERLRHIQKNLEVDRDQGTIEDLNSLIDSQKLKKPYDVLLQQSEILLAQMLKFEEILNKERI